MTESLSVVELCRRLERGEPTFLLDVRVPREFAAWRIEGPRELPALNVPYTRIFEAADDDLAAAAATYAAEQLAGRLPREPLVIAVCAKGNSSAFVAAGLRAGGWQAANLEGGMAAWAAHHEVRAVAEEAALAVLQVARPARGCVSHVVLSGGRALIVDALRHTEPYLALLAERGARAVAVADTHAHADHLSGGPRLAERLGCPYLLHPYDALHPVDLLPATIPYTPLADGGRLTVGDVAVEALHVPGHTLGSVALRVDGRFLIAGDTLFVGSIARPDLGGQAEAWTPLHQASLRRLLALPPETVVLPAHVASPREIAGRPYCGATVAELIAANEGARRALGDAAAFRAWVLGSLPHFPPEYLEIKRANLGLAAPDEARASELELGPNMCALG